MIASCLATVLAAAVLPGPLPWVDVGRRGPPQPYNERVTLPGEAPSDVRSLQGSWHHGYLIRGAQLESGESDLMVTRMLLLREDQTYELQYHARWNLPKTPMPWAGGTPAQPGAFTVVEGRIVREQGKYWLSGGLLLLEPANTELTDTSKHSTNHRPQPISNENHVWIVTLDDGQPPTLTVAGRCASYQLDPVCNESPTVWYSMTSAPGQRWFGRGAPPRPRP